MAEEQTVQDIILDLAGELLDRGEAMPADGAERGVYVETASWLIDRARAIMAAMPKPVVRDSETVLAEITREALKALRP